ncbi:hypothetical protein [Paenibacillus sp. NEAU-GSW1]|uniref:hypothetical protein n=1 Tax=Paenibacillus sp. NEAU-GSW1 TaxID=2682486 RepID=UPI0012E1EB0D|nr:hypothetical protein [Paenibacillus sp. NEAU-GSW1]MUT66466.1 hypothetical protein [Paenibacillus sp. NEAU-GSW1]
MVKLKEVDYDEAFPNGLDDRCRSLYERIRELNVDAEWSESPGGHDIGYWRGHLESYLIFYGGKALP